MDNFLSVEEIEQLGIKQYGTDVKIGRHVVLYTPNKLIIGNHVRIDDFTVISGNVTLHSYIHISQFCGLYGEDDGIEMFDFSAVSSKCSIYATSDDYSGMSMTNPMTPTKFKPTYISAPVVFCKHAIIGCNTVVLPGVTLKEGAAVGSMSLVNRDVDAWTINVGIPCKKIKNREKDILDYEKQFLLEEI